MKKIGYAIGLVVLIMIGVVSGAYIIQNLDENVMVNAQEMFSSEKEEEKFLVEVGPFLSNLKDSETKKSNYIKIDITLEVSGKKNKEIIEKQLPVARDVINSLLIQTKREDVLNKEKGETILKGEIKQHLNQAIFEDEHSITDIFLTDLLIQ